MFLFEQMEMPHANLPKVSRMELVEVYAVMRDTTSLTTPARVLPVFSLRIRIRKGAA